MTQSTDDKEAYYEKVKYRNFRESSRLDGIELPEEPPTESLEEIVRRYTEKE